MKTQHFLLSLIACALVAAAFLFDPSAGVALAMAGVAMPLDEIATEIKRVVGEVNTKTAEMDARMAAVEQLAVKGNRGGSGHGPAPNALRTAIRETFLGSAAVAELKARRVSTGMLDLGGLDLKTLVSANNGDSNSGTWDVQPERIAGAWGHPIARRFWLMEALTQFQIKTNALEIHQLQGFTAAAAAQEHEGAEKAEQAVDTEPTKFPVATVAVWMPMSKQLLEDDAVVGQVMGKLLGHTVLAKAERLAIYGTGNSGEPLGLWTDATTFTPASGATLEDAIGEACAALESSGYSANLIVLHPNDWRQIQARKSTENGQYLMGSPSAPVPPTLWNAQVIVSPSINEGDHLVLDRSYCLLLDRQNVMAGLFEQDGDNVKRNLVTLRVEGRWGTAVLDTAAVMKFATEVASG